MPYFFFYLRDNFRDSDSFTKQRDLIKRMKNFSLEAFDTASIFIGGFFGYEKFYDDYYTKLKLPILNRTNENKTNSDEIIQSVETGAVSTPNVAEKSKTEISEAESVVSDTDSDGGDQEPFGTELYATLHSKIEDWIEGATPHHRNRKNKILKYLENKKNNDKALNEIWNAFLAKQTKETKELIRTRLGFYPKTAIEDIQGHVQETENK